METKEQQIQQEQQEQQITQPLGKFKSVEELMKAYEEAEKKITELAERAKRAEELLEVYNTTSYSNSVANNILRQQGQQENEDYYSKILDNPKEVFEKFSKELEQRILNKIQEERIKQLQAIQIYESFYSKNPDLKGFEPIVGYFADLVQRQYPNESLDKVLEIIADKARKYIAEKRLTGSVSGQPAIGVAEPQKAKVVKKTEEVEEYNPEKELQEFLEERAKDKQKRLFIR